MLDVRPPFSEVELVTSPPFSERRSTHFWAHELMCISVKQPESLMRMRFPLGQRYPTADTLKPGFLEVELCIL